MIIYKGPMTCRRILRRILRSKIISVLTMTLVTYAHIFAYESASPLHSGFATRN